MSHIQTSPSRLTVVSRNSDFPKLAELERFLDLRPIGRAARVAAALEALATEGQAS